MNLTVRKTLIRGTASAVLIGAIVLGNAQYALAEFNAKVHVTQDSIMRPSIEADESSGALVHSIPLTLPPGRNGLTPQLALSYNSQRANNTNLIGYGWDITIPSIERVNKTGTERLYIDNNFTSSFDGELSPIATSSTVSTYGARVATTDTMDYVFDEVNDVWRAKAMDGTVYTFGSTTASRLSDPSDSTKIYRWMLKEIRDRNDNYVSYVYAKNDGYIYPSTVTYSGNGATDGDFQVSFSTTTRNDYPTSYEPAFAIQSQYRIDQILVKVDGAWVRKYDLAYTTGANGKRSLLSSVTLTGKDKDGNTTALPATTFTYQTGSVGWQIDSAWDSPVDFVKSNEGGDNGIRFAEMNGDGLIDLTQAYDTAGGGVCDVKNSWLNNGSGWTQSSGVVVPECFAKQPAGEDDTGVRLGDFNGDGMTDLVQAREENGSTTEKFYLNSNKGLDFQSHSEWNIPAYFYHWSSGYLQTMLMDVNTDGGEDLLEGGSVFLFNATTTGWDAAANVYGNAGDATSDPTGTRFADINGDGLVDRLVAAYHTEPGFTEDKNKVFLNSGTAFPGYNELIPVDFYSGLNNDKGVRIADVNNDGLPDIIQEFRDLSEEVTRKVWVNKTSTSTPFWEYSASLSSSLPPILFIHQTAQGHKDSGWRTADVNGDGLVDFIGTYYYDPPTNEIELETYINTGNHADVLSRVTTAEGGTIDVSYKSSLQYKTAAGKLLNIETPSPIMTVNTITRRDGFNTAWTETREYAGASYYHNDAANRRFAGFHNVTTTDGAGNKTKTYFHTGSSTDSALGEYDDDIAKAGRPYRVEVYDGAGNLYSKTINTWERYHQGVNRDFVKLARTINFSYDGNGSHKDSAETYLYDSASRLPTYRQSWGEVTGTDAGTFSDVGTDTRATTLSYATSTDIRGLLSRELVSDNASTTVRDAKHYYDGLALGSANKGNETKREAWVSGGTFIDSEKTYDGTYGLVTQEKDPRDKITTFTYDPKNIYTATTTDPVGLVTGRYYDYSSGKVERIIDPNGRVFETIFDGLDRVTAEKIPNADSPSTLVTKTTRAYTDTVGSRKVLQTAWLNTATSTETHTYLDGFDRTIQTRKKAEDANTYSVRDSVYDRRELLARESLPYFATGSSRSASTTQSALYSVFSYDAQKRPVSEANALGTTTHSYDDWIATTTDSLGNAKQFVRDAFQNLITVREYNDGNTYTSLYEYDVNNNLTKITDSLANVRNFTYDGLSRLTKSEDLHDASDTGFASTTYAYDASGNITTKLDGKNQTVTYTYDDINRALTENYTGASGTEITYSYDWCAEGKGRLCSATTTEAGAHLSYDALGNVVREARTMGGATHATTFAYDRQGNLATLTYPDAAQTLYAYNNGGLLENVHLLHAGQASPNPVIADVDYAPTEASTLRLFGNRDTSIYTYDANALYRLTRVLSMNATTTAFNGSNPVITVGSTNVQKDGADLVGNLISLMGGASATVGFRYGVLLDDDDPWTGTTTTATLTDTGPYTITLLNRDAFKDYSYQAYASTSAGTFYGDRYRFYTADLSQSYPVYKEHQRAWTLKNYNDDGTHASTTVDGKLLKLRNWGSTTTPSYQSGYWLSDPWDLSTITNVEDSFIEYCVCARNGADVLVKTAITTSTTTPSAGSFIVATSTTSIPGISAGSNLGGKYLWLKIEMTPSYSATGTPCLCRINLAINNVGTTTTAHNALQHSTYTYDAAGNITQIKDISGFGADKTVNYTYDDLYRLTNASTTLASHGNYNQTFAYNALGNITSAPLGSYSYGETGYANPHAATSIGGTSLSYDNNGNVTAHGSNTYTWNYRDRLTKSIVGGITTLYGYDFNSDRVTKGNGTATTTYANRYFNQIGATTTKHIYDNAGLLLATVEGNGISTTTNYVHTDHLGSTNVVTDETGSVVQALDYYPFGSERVDAGSFDSQRQYIGEVFDEESSLSYLNARYYSGDRGQFMSQDPVFLENPAGQNLQNPQSLNSYSYGENNPIVKKDPTGKEPATIGAATGLFLIWSWASLLYAGLQGQIRDYEIETMQLYPEVFTAVEVRQAESVNRGADTYDAVSVVAGTINPTAGAAVDVVGVGKDIYDLNHPNGPSFGQFFSNLGGPSEYVTTPATLQQTNTTHTGASNSSNFNSAYSSISTASQAISSGDYKAAQGYLDNASAALDKIKK